MGHLDPTLVLSQLVGGLPTFVAIILAWMHSNKRIDDLRSEMHALIEGSGRETQGSIDGLRNETRASIDGLRNELKDLIRSESALIRAEMRRVEDVMDARLRHLEAQE
jgi:hypothetical protein